jgi:hypothetical protein
MGPSYSIYMIVWLMDGPIRQSHCKIYITKWAHPSITHSYIYCTMGPSVNHTLIYILYDGPIRQSHIHIYISAIHEWANNNIYISCIGYLIGPSAIYEHFIQMGPSWIAAGPYKLAGMGPPVIYDTLSQLVPPWIARFNDWLMWWLTDGPIIKYIYECVIDGWAHPTVYILECD